MPCADVLVAKAMLACGRCGVATLAVVGGVAANRRLRQEMAAACAAKGIRLLIPPLNLCTDNAAMIGGMAWFHLSAGDIAPLDVEALPR